MSDFYIDERAGAWLVRCPSGSRFRFETEREARAFIGKERYFRRRSKDSVKQDEFYRLTFEEGLWVLTVWDNAGEMEVLCESQEEAISLIEKWELDVKMPFSSGGQRTGFGGSYARNWWRDQHERLSR